MASDRTLSNAPLVEVIAEIHWALQPGPSSQLCDRDWFRMWLELEPALLEHFQVIEPLHAAGVSVPLEMLGRSPLMRYRPASNGWPLAQLGQGILTVNAVPPYDGWSAIRGVLERVLRSGTEKSPRFANVKLERFQLMYRDAFLPRHGVTNVSRFFVDQVKLVDPNVISRVGILSSGTDDLVTTSGEVTMNLALPAGATVAIKGTAGQIGSNIGMQPAAILDFIVSGPAASQLLDPAVVLKWFDDAHEVAWKCFDRMIPADLMRQLKGEDGK